MLWRVEFLRRDIARRGGAFSDRLMSADSESDLHEMAWTESKARKAEGIRVQNLHTGKYKEVWD